MRSLRTAIAACLLVLSMTPIGMTGAQAAGSAFLTGVVTQYGKTVRGVAVQASGNNVTAQTKTDADGKFLFATLLPGSYVVTAYSSSGAASVSVDLPASGANVTVALDAKQIGTVRVAGSTPVRQSGTDVTLNRTVLTHLPAAGSFPELLVQLPGAARGANGVIHINGDHGDINYIVDGVSIPQELNRNIGTEFNSNDVAYIDVLQGAYPAQYGERFASVLNIDTRGSVGRPGFNGEVGAGSFGSVDSALGYQSVAGAGSLVAAVRSDRTDRGLDPPNPDSPHNTATDANQFARYTLPHGNDYLNLTFSHAYRTFQIPIDVAGGQPVTSDDNESQDDLFSALQFRHALGDRGAFSYGFAYKRSHIRDFGDPSNDWIYGEALNIAAGGLPTDCFNALRIPNYFNGTCAYSLNTVRTATDYKFTIDNALTSGPHEIRWGGMYDITHVAKLYDVTLQPGNFLAPIFTPATPNAPYSVIDNAPNDGHTEAAYLQDSWRMGGNYEFDYGLREDAFQLRSTEFDRGFSMLSPRLKLTRFWGPRASAYIFYGRFFTPFSFENVSPTAAQILDMPLQPTVAQFDLRPQRDSDYELGAHMPLGDADFGFRVMQKNAADLIDDTQVGVTLLHQDINYKQGRIATQTVYYQMPLQRGGRFYVTANHTYSVNKGCETQLLAPCFGSPTDWTPADHEQRWGSTSGVILNDSRGGWFSIDGEYGSGLSSAGCQPGTTGGPCKFTPHITFDAAKAVPIGSETKALLRVRNLLNHEYLITYLNAQGNHYYTRRTVELSLQFGGH